VFAARAAHPGTSVSSSSASVAQPTSASNDEGDFGFDFGQGSIGPSTGAPAVQSGAS
jgi:hypothetical protein